MQQPVNKYIVCSCSMISFLVSGVPQIASQLEVEPTTGIRLLWCWTVRFVAISVSSFTVVMYSVWRIPNGKLGPVFLLIQTCEYKEDNIVQLKIYSSRLQIPDW